MVRSGLDPTVKSEAKTIEIRVPDLKINMDLGSNEPGGIERNWRFNPNIPNHQGFRFADISASGAFEQTGREYQLWFNLFCQCNEFPFLRLGAVSLERGGLLDIDSNWAVPYQHHREGKTFEIGDKTENAQLPGVDQRLNLELLNAFTSKFGLYEVEEQTLFCSGCKHYEYRSK